MTNSKGITFQPGSWYYCPAFDYYFCYAMDSENGILISAKKTKYGLHYCIYKDSSFATFKDGVWYYEVTNDEYINDAELANMDEVNKFINPE